MIFGTTCVACGSVLSTMDVAREHFRRTGDYGTVVQAQTQTAGRGRQGKPWFTPPEGTQLSMTVVGYPVPLADAWRLAPLAGLAVAEGIAACLPCEPRLRFPNDVLLGGKKLAGVLIETIAREAGQCVPLLGIGVNVNVPEESFPKDLVGQATSLRRELGREVVEPVALSLLEALGNLWDEAPGSWLPRWHARLAPEATRIFMREGRAQPGRVVLLKENGQLVLEGEEGGLWTVSAPQVILGED